MWAAVIVVIMVVAVQEITGSNCRRCQYLGGLATNVTCVKVATARLLL